MEPAFYLDSAWHIIFMTGKLYIISILSLLSFNSCCRTSDSRLPSGYPYNGHSQELNFIVYSSPDYYSHPRSYETINYIRDTTQYTYVLGGNPDIDFAIHNLAYVKGIIREVESGQFQIRVLINHNEKTYKIEVRSSAKTCNGSIFGSDVHDVTISKFILIPKVPEGYIFSVQRIGL